MNIFIPENVLPVTVLTPAADAGGRTGAVYQDVGKANKVWLCVFINQGNAATVQLDPVQATASAGTGTKALTNNCNIWANQDMAAYPFVKQTAAKTFTTSAAVKTKMVIFEIDASCLDIAGGFRYISVTTGASNAANITSAFLLTEPRFGGATGI